MSPDPTKTFPSWYEIRVAGRIAAERADWFSGLALIAQVTREGATITILSGTLADQAALFGVLNRIRDMGLRLISVAATESPLNGNVPTNRSQEQAS